MWAPGADSLSQPTRVLMRGSTKCHCAGCVLHTSLCYRQCLLRGLPWCHVGSFESCQVHAYLGLVRFASSRQHGNSRRLSIREMAVLCVRCFAHRGMSCQREACLPAPSANRMRMWDRCRFTPMHASRALATVG